MYINNNKLNHIKIKYEISKYVIFYNKSVTNFMVQIYLHLILGLVVVTVNKNII